MVAGQLRAVAGLLAAPGLGCALLALFYRVRFAGGALFALTIEYMVVEATGGAGHLSVIGYATGLVVFCEAVFWLDQLPPEALVARSVLVERILGLGLAGAGAAVLALVVLLASGLEFPGSFQAALAGASAAAAVLALPWLLLRRTGRKPAGN